MTDPTAERLKQFQARATDQSEDVRVAPKRMGRYIPVHPMADDTDLPTLGVQPDACTKVDCYWERLGTDAVFLQVYSATLNQDRPPGLYARWNNWVPRWMNLVAVLNEDRISSLVVHDVMRRFCLVELQEKSLKDTLTPVGDEVHLGGGD